MVTAGESFAAERRKQGETDSQSIQGEGFCPGAAPHWADLEPLGDGYPAGSPSYLPRFLSLLVLSALAVCFLAGLRATAPDMKLSADAYFDQQNLMDLHIASTLGLTQEDVDAIAEEEGVASVQGAYTIDALVPMDNQEMVVKVLSYSGEGDVNQPALVEGRLPEGEDECLVEPLFLELSGLSIGDTISLDTGERDYADALSVEEVTIVGTANSPLYIALDRGSSTLGTGSVDAFLILPVESFTMDYYTDAYLLAEGASELETYSDEYEELVDQLAQQLEPLSKERSALRYDEASQAISDAEDELAQAEEEANQQLTDAEAEITSSRQELDDAKKQLEDAKKQLDSGEAQYAAGMEQLESGWQALDAASLELEDGKEQYEQGQTAYQAALALYQIQAAAVERQLETQVELEASTQARTQATQAALQAATEAALEDPFPTWKCTTGSTKRPIRAFTTRPMPRLTPRRRRTPPNGRNCRPTRRSWIRPRPSWMPPRHS